MENFIFYIQQGFYHVLDKAALDHVLFFIALTIIFSYKSWKKALWLITFFTIAHTLTFGLSVYDLIEVKVDLVEFLIPITILIPLLINIYREIKQISNKKENINIYFAFIFGLIHGLGFSNYFKMLLDDSDSKLLPLLKFSLGIEFAQILIVLIVLFLNYTIRFTPIKNKIWVIGISILLILRIIPMLINRFPFG